MLYHDDEWLWSHFTVAPRPAMSEGIGSVSIDRATYTTPSAYAWVCDPPQPSYVLHKRGLGQGLARITV